MVKNLPPTGDARDLGLNPRLGRSLGVGNGNLVQYSCLQNSMDRRAWQATVHEIAKSWTQLNDWVCIHTYHIICIHLCYLMHQFSSVTQSCLTLCGCMNCSTPGLPVHHQLPEITQTHVHQVRDAIQPSHPWSSPSSPAPNLSQHQSLLQWVNSSQ